MRMALPRLALALQLLMSYMSQRSLAGDVEMGKIDGGGLINLGNRQHTWTPLMSLTSPLSEIRSITSNFSFRTFDPEGALFYGDTRDGLDWFLLSLRGGIPEMQIGKANMMVSAVGGPKLNDGVWHKLELRSEDLFVVLKVDGKRELVVGLHPEQPEAPMEGNIRLALGGILIDKQRLLIPLNPQLDACINEGHWLNLSTPWDTTPKRTDVQCSVDIKAGSYFPGTGLAVFNTSELQGFDPVQKEIVIRVEKTSNKWNGAMVYLQSAASSSPVLSMTGDSDSKIMTFKMKDFDVIQEYRTDFTVFEVKIQPKLMTVERQKKNVNDQMLVDGDFSSVFAKWKEGMLLTFGGVPGDNADFKGSDYMEGCLDKIIVQGQIMDLDEAFFKDLSVSSHSCPL